MVQVAETTLKALRELVDNSEADPQMVKFVQDKAVGYVDSTPVRITIDGPWVTYSLEE